MTTENLVQLTDETFDTEVMQADGPVLVDFHAPWCIDCRMLEPVLADVADEYAGRVKVCSIDVDKNPKTGDRFSISTIPVLTLFTDGLEVAKLINVKDTPTITAMLDEALP